jgi:two-component system phosphate regulon sensor histidine kinase PhoR
MYQASENAKHRQTETLNEDLENYFANTIIPQMFVDAGLILRKFTPPAMKQFTLTPDDLGKSITDVIDNIRYPTLIQNIEEVIATGTNLEKEVQTLDHRWFQMNIIPIKFLKKIKRRVLLLLLLILPTV